MDNRGFVNLTQICFEKSGMSASAFGKHVAHDPSFLMRLKKGREVKESTRQRYLMKMLSFVKTNQDKSQQARVENG